jgi:hypothetical protein
MVASGEPDQVRANAIPA